MTVTLERICVVSLAPLILAILQVLLSFRLFLLLKHNLSLGNQNKLDACLHTQHLGADIISNLPEHILAGSGDMFLTQVASCIGRREGLIALVGDGRVEGLSP
jgi:hypothetical protein